MPRRLKFLQNIVTRSDYQRWDCLVSLTIRRQPVSDHRLAGDTPRRRWTWAHHEAHYRLEGQAGRCHDPARQVDEIAADFGAMALLVPRDQLRAQIDQVWRGPAVAGDMLAWWLWCADHWEHQLRVPWQHLGIYLLRTVAHALDYGLWMQYVAPLSAGRTRRAALSAMLRDSYPTVWDHWTGQRSPSYTRSSLSGARGLGH